MPRSYTLDRQQTLFDEPRLIADAGLLLPATLAQRLGLSELLDQHLNLGAAAGRANVADKALTLIMSALAGGDCIDDADAVRAGTGEVLHARLRRGRAQTVRGAANFVAETLSRVRGAAFARSLLGRLRSVHVRLGEDHSI